jgi:hypothetical protein
MLFKNSVRTSKRTPHFTVTKIDWLMLFKEVIAVYSENHTKPVNTKRYIIDCRSRWFILLLLRLKELMKLVVLQGSVSSMVFIHYQDSFYHKVVSI